MFHGCGDENCWAAAGNAEAFYELLWPRRSQWTHHFPRHLLWHHNKSEFLNRETLQKLPGHCWMIIQQSQHTNNVALPRGDGVPPLCLVVLRRLQHYHKKMCSGQSDAGLGRWSLHLKHPFCDVGGLRQAPWNRNTAADIDAT